MKGFFHLFHPRFHQARFDGHHDGGTQGRGRRERLFDSGHMKLLVLHILEQQPAHGYEVIRAIAELVGGDYSPSPGTVYPTLSYLEDMNFARSSAQDGGRKQYTLTEEGAAHLHDNQAALAALLERLGQGRRHARARRSPELQRAMENLKTALRLRFAEELPDADTVQRIAEIIDRAAVDVGRA